MERSSGTTGRKASIRGLMVEAWGDERARLRDTPPAMKPQRWDGLPDGEVPPCRVVFGRLVETLAHAACSAQASA